MMTTEEIREAIASWGAESGAPVVLDEDGACTMPLGEDGALHLQLREGVGELDLVALLGEVPADVRAEVFESMLTANCYWRETFGATLAWHAQLQQAVLAYPLPLKDLDKPTLASACDAFVTLAETWIDRLARDIRETQEDLAAAEDAEEGEEDDADGRASGVVRIDG